MRIRGRDGQLSPLSRDVSVLPTFFSEASAGHFGGPLLLSKTLEHRNTARIGSLAGAIHVYSFYCVFGKPWYNQRENARAKFLREEIQLDFDWSGGVFNEGHQNISNDGHAEGAL